MKFHSAFNVCNYYRAPDYSKLNESFHEKTKKFKKEKKKWVRADALAEAAAKKTEARRRWWSCHHATLQPL